MKYDAFISYRHLETDMFVAKNIHKTLESFKLPKKLRKKARRANLERVFRDQDELPTSNNLSEMIMQALIDSEYLIVICTPKLKESEWCIKEINTFKQLHGYNKIIAVLAEGEPAEAFPKELLEYDYTYVDSDGNTITDVKRFEPLAADVRGKSKRAIKKKIKSESLKILAPMFELAYDDLKQRHKQRKIKRIATLSSCALVAIAAITIVGAILTTKIKEQSSTIEIENSIKIAKEAVELREGGFKEEAIEKACEALALNENEETRNAYLFASGMYAPEGIYDIAHSVELSSSPMLMSSCGNKLAVIDVRASISLYDSDTNICKPLEGILPCTVSANNLFFSDEQHLFVNTDSGIVIIDTDTLEQIGKIADSGALYVYDDILYVLSNSGNINAYNVSDYSLCYAIPRLSDYNLDNLCLSSDGKRIIVSENIEYEKHQLFILDAKTGEILIHTDDISGQIYKLYAFDNTFVATTFSINEEDNSQSYSAYVIDDISGNILWKSNSSSDMFSYCYYDKQNDYLVAATLQSISTYSLNQPEPIHQINVDSLMYVDKYSGKDDIFYVFLSDGRYMSYKSLSGEFDVCNEFYVKPGYEIFTAAFAEDTIYTTNKTNRLYCYKKVHNENIVKITETEEAVSFTSSLSEGRDSVTPDDVPAGEAESGFVKSFGGKYLFCYSLFDDGARLYSLDGKEKLGSIDIKSRMINQAFFTSDNKYICVLYQNDKLDIIKIPEMEIVATIDEQFNYPSHMCPLQNGGYLIDDSSYTYLYNENFKLEYKLYKSNIYKCVGYDEEADMLIYKSPDELYGINLFNDFSNFK